MVEECNSLSAFFEGRTMIMERPLAAFTGLASSSTDPSKLGENAAHGGDKWPARPNANDARINVD